MNLTLNRVLSGVGQMAVLSGEKWGDEAEGSAGGVVTWSLVGRGRTDIRDLSGFNTSPFSVDADTVLPFDAAIAMREAFDTWAAVANIEFVQVEDDNARLGQSQQIDIRVSFGEIDTENGGILAFAFFPGLESVRGAVNGDMVFDSDETAFYSDRDQFLNVAIHEIGHAIGLDHEDSVQAIMNSFASNQTELFADDISGSQQIYGVQDNAAVVLDMDSLVNDLSVLEEKAFQINGNARNNDITGGDGDETIDGGDGNDSVVGGGGDDVLRDGEGNDTYFGGDGDDILEFTFGFDAFEFTNFGDNTIFARRGGETNRIDSSVEKISFNGVEQNFEALQFSNAGDFDDTVTGSDAGERLNGGADNDLIVGDDGDDILKGRDGNDGILGGAGNEIVLGGNGDDTILGGAGNDTLKPGRGNDSLDGGEGDDILAGFRGDEILIGGAGNDTLLGNLDDDTLEGGSGDDRMQGGPGRDVFLYRDSDFGDDRIVRDFRVGSDTIDFSNVTDINELADLNIRQVGTSTVISVIGGDASIVVGSVSNIIGNEDLVFIF